MNGAADEKSPGTSSSPSESRSGGSSDTERGRRTTVAPASASISSVWSRVGAGSSTVVFPSAFSPASRTADFTCALATGSSYSIPCSGLPSTTSGGPGSTCAPIWASGSAIRPIGRFESDSSPVRT